jgi:prevent-host-death family protein
MRFSTHVRPISHVKAHAAEILDRLATDGEPVLITQNGEARAVLQDVHSYEETQETLAMLKLLALGQQQVEAGMLTPARDVIARLKAKTSPTSL